MASGQPPRIYVSAMETEVEGQPRFDPRALRLLTRLAEVGYVVAWEKEFRGYDIIETDLATCDALLAIVDSTWSCSTWMAIEAEYALRGPGSGLTTRMRPIPVLLYPIASDASLRYPFNSYPSVLLDRNVENAVAQVREKQPLVYK